MTDRFSLSAAGVQVVLEASTGRLPAVLHWGADLGPLDDSSFDALELAAAQTTMVNGPDIPTRLAIIPEGWTGWVGHPGLSGSRAGRDWSPRFTVASIDVDGDVDHRGGVANIGAATVVFHASDEITRLGLDVIVEMLDAGILRVRAIVTNLASELYQVDQLLVALPVPSRAREVLDFSGRWAKERVPQRRTLGVGTHWREARHGRTGPDSAYVLHLGTPGFGFADGEIWATHTAWSGNHVHYAERVLTSDQVIGGGELLLPGEIVLAEQESYASPWVYANYATGLDAVARRFHTYLRARPQHPDAARPVTLNVWEAVYF
ncbi:MAG TPA: glycoside hydrolase family 36 N-terminal domain-containing protein, partial [Propionibacteriaceae bacterium]|nr:glycoside hydrolase family 36 N-terminal domain-containing protein [Propionibacteriaceae bacterium]